MTEVHVVVPAGIDDRDRPSGGNAYDRHLVTGLRELGWGVVVHEVGGGWPTPDLAALTRLARTLARIDSGATVVVDGLVASCSGSVLIGEAARLALVVLVHMPLGAGDPAAAALERGVLSAAAAVVTTSEWTRDLLLATYGLAPGAVHVATPGVVTAPEAGRSPAGDRLLCVATVVSHKGHLDLLEALALVVDLPWTLVCVGSVTVDGAHAAVVRRCIERLVLADRVDLVGVRTGRALHQAYAVADLVVLPSRAETYGMVVTEALARAVPVVATSVGGVPEALGGTAASRPGLLVPPGRPDALAAALRAWLEEEPLRARLREAAAERRPTLAGWSVTAQRVSSVLDRVRAD